MLFICGSYVEEVFCKFDKDEDGYFNRRMEEEAVKRSNYAESRRNNRKKSESASYDKDMINISKTYVQHMEDEDENINVIKNTTKTKKRTIEKREAEPHALNSYIQQHYADTVAKMAVQMTADECEKLKGNYQREFIISVLDEMRDWEPLLSKRKDVLKTFRTFARNKEQGFKK
jgi:hypothetical protein